MEALSDWKGRLIGGRYELEEYIFKGGMGHVFKAWDCKQECWVAVKIATIIPGEDPFGDNMISRLKREVAALKRLNHPCIVRLLDWGKEADLSFAVLEYLQGVNLGIYIDHVIFARPPNLCVHIVVQVLEAVAVMQKSGFIHRDIKPSNIMVAEDDTIKLIDFGTAKPLLASGRRRKRLTLPGYVPGTPGYLSPEQSKGKRLDFSSDLYNCGLVLFELLTGELPFPERHIDVDVEGRERQMGYFFKRSNVSKKIQIVIRKALQIDHKLRYQTAKEMQLALVEATRPFSLRRWFKDIRNKICAWFSSLK